MRSPRVFVILALILVLGVPFLFRPESARPPDGALRLVIISPHNEQIRAEFGRAFSDWHEANFGVPVVIDWRRPGGTTEIRRQLEAQYTAAIRDGRISPDGAAQPGVMPYDILLGGGSYEHEQIKRGVTVQLRDAGEPRAVRIPFSIPVDFDDATLFNWFGANIVGAQPLYDDPDKYYFGTALSGFGIAFNRDALAHLGLTEPDSWDDLTDHRYSGWLALADPRQSGSVATSYDSILSNLGWDDGWRLLRAMCANARYFSASSAKVVIDVAHGDAAAALSIDFYGRYESQALRKPGQSADESRVGYVDPPGVVFIDPDPVSVLRGGPSPDLARRFVEFCMSDEGQALWQFPAVGEQAEPGALGPREFELRRMPIVRSMYDKHFDSFVDKVDPFKIASPVASKGWRSLIGPMFGAFAIDVHHEMRTAWDAMHRAKQNPDADPALIAQMEDAFYAMPLHTLPSGETLEFTEANYRAIRADWAARDRAAELRIEYTKFFKARYAEVTRLAATAQ